MVQKRQQSVDGRDYLAGQKVYVEVDVDRLSGGGIVPRSFVWEDGTIYKVEKIICICPSIILRSSFNGLRYTVRIKQQNAHMYLEDCDGMGRWYLQRKKQSAKGGK